ncbi:MAG: EAL domain-containing protein [Anaerolineaceae bacterium]|nr:MAG: EAL domain-containing protein [Anaerolineaceae bacterium]
MKVFLEEQTILLLIVIASIAILLLLIFVFFRIGRLRRKLEESYQENMTINSNYKKLESLYQSTISSYNKLNTRYDELHKNRESIKKLAYTDHLTELPNRIAFIEMLDNIMLTLRSDEIIGIMDIDLDNFKNINDTLGHSYGDELLIDVTHRLKQVMDENDYLARIGGDEFIILSQNLIDTVSYEEKIRKVRNVFTFPFELSTKEYFITVSIGAAFAPKDGKTAQNIIKNVDSAMYVAKANGKNTYAYFESTFNQMLTEKIELQSELRQAIEKKEFVLFYQAQMDLMKKKVLGFEALIRWNHPSKGLLYPKDFIYLAEESGLIVPIGKWVLKSACLQLKEWMDMGYNSVSMAVNLSARQFKDKDFVQMVFETIEDTGVDPQKLELEITESVALEDLDYTITTIKELKAIGVRFSLDDFGTGYSSMSYLKRLPVSNLKIDKSFLDTVMDDTSDQKIIQAIISLARNLDLHVIAEGVERSDQEQFLQESNCNIAQGFLYSKPVPKEKAVEFLHSVNL